MKRYVTLITLAVMSCAGYAFGAMLRASYTDPAGCYVEPAEYYMMRDGVRLPADNISFENLSTAAGPNVPGRVGVVYLNATTSGYYEFQARNSQGNWRGYDWVYMAPAECDPVTVVPFQGSVSYESASFGSDVHVVRGDSVSIPYSAGMGLTGWQVWFAAKANPADSAYAVGPVDITAQVTDPVAGTGLIGLSASDTDVTPRRYYAELELRSQGLVRTPLRFYLWIDPDVVR